MRSTNYYDHQFGLLISLRQYESEFLCTLRLCYDIGLERTKATIDKLQQGIFGSLCSEPHNKLATWVYLSGQYYSMHDVCREAVKLTDYIKLRILNYISENFVHVITEEPSQIHSTGLFLGRNIQFMPRDRLHPFLPDSIYRSMKSSIIFERALGQGVGEKFESLDEDLQAIILDKVETEIEFGTGLAETLGQNFPSFDEEHRKEVLQKLYSAILFADTLARA
jgi:hypothetical protein